MIENVAKKYTKALISSLDENHLRAFLVDLGEIVNVFSIEKFLDIIRSPYVLKSRKQAFLCELLKLKDEKIINFIALLAENDRLEIIPFVHKELQIYISEKNKFYVGLLYLNKKVEPNVIEQITKSLSIRLGIGLEIRQIEVCIDGIKLVIDDLDIEISFSRENFLNELKSYVLKAI